MNTAMLEIKEASNQFKLYFLFKALTNILFFIFLFYLSIFFIFLNVY